MVNFDKIDNPFTDDMLYSIDCFRDGRKFYDCVGRKFIDNDSAYENLQYSFHTYFLTGNDREWIGYILFHNADYVKGYINLVNQELKLLLGRLKTNINNSLIVNKIISLELRLNENYFYKNTNLSFLEEELEELFSKCYVLNKNIKDIFLDYYSKINRYFEEYNMSYDVDVFITLPVNTEDMIVEEKYYGFIGEVYSKLEKLIIEDFSDIRINFTNDRNIVSIVNDSHNKDILVIDKVKKKYYF